MTLTATVAGVGGGPAPSLGTVTFTEGVGGPAVSGCSAVTLPATPLQCVTSGLAGGSHGIVASYDGTADPNYGTGASAVLSYSIAQGTPTVTVSASPASPGPVALGTPVTFTATVAGVAGAPAPAGGTAMFTEGVGGPAVPGCTAVTLPAAPVECVTTGLTGGSHSIVVSYNGTSDPSYNNGDSAALSYTVTEVAPTVTLAANPSGSVPLGTPVTFTATVTGAAGGPAPTGGTVSFTQGVGGPAVPGCPPATLPAAAQCVTAGLTVGAHANIVATYNGGGDISYTNDDSPLLSVTVTPAAPAVTLAASPATSAQLGGSVMFTASVAGVAGTPPTGTVNFTDGAGGPTIPGCAAQPVGPGSAQCTTSGLALGSHAIVANYSGDTNYLAGSATLAAYQITRATPFVALNAAPASSVVVGNSASFTANVAGVSGVPAPIGTVTFTVDGVAVAACPAVTLPTSPVCTPPSLAVGPHTVVATYSGDTNYLTGSATVAGYQVTARASAVTLLASPAGPVDVGAPVTFTAVVTGDGSGILPGGTVSFAAAVGALATLAGCEAVPVSGSGQAICTTTALPAGSVRIVASYSGDPLYAASSGEISGYTVNASLALTGTGEEAGTGAETETDTELANTGTRVDRMLLGALLLLGAGGGFLAFGSALGGRRRATRPSGPDSTRHNRRS
ncbi:MAG: Ig-like domain repeat protein [Labedaea sp.]